MAAVWCRSVGTSWTLELHGLDGGTALGTILDWISSGVPIAQPEPDTLARELPPNAAAAVPQFVC